MTSLPELAVHLVGGSAWTWEPQRRHTEPPPFPQGAKPPSKLAGNQEVQEASWTWGAYWLDMGVAVFRFRDSHQLSVGTIRNCRDNPQRLPVMPCPTGASKRFPFFQFRDTPTTQGRAGVRGDSGTHFGPCSKQLSERTAGRRCRPEDADRPCGLPTWTAPDKLHHGLQTPP